MTPDSRFEKTLKDNNERLRILLEAMQRRGKPSLLDENMANLLIKDYLNSEQKGAA